MAFRNWGIPKSSSEVHYSRNSGFLVLINTLHQQIVCFYLKIIILSLGSNKKIRRVALFYISANLFEVWLETLGSLICCIPSAVIVLVEIDKENLASQI